MSKFYIIFIFLYATVLGTNVAYSKEDATESNDSIVIVKDTATVFAVADGYLSCRNYEMAIVEYERCFYGSQSRDVSYKALQQKALCYKLIGQYIKAATTLERVADTYEDYYQIVLCYYLGNDFIKANEMISKTELYFDALKEDMLLLKVLTLNEINEYNKSYNAAIELADKLNGSAKVDIKRFLERMYKKLSKLKSEKTARVLSFVPGLAHIYAGDYVQGISAFTLNFLVLGFGTWQIFESCYVTAYLGGASLLSVTYPGAMQSGMYAVKKLNYKKTSEFNNSFKIGLLSLLKRTNIKN
ncbi:MAG: hypothetical protein ACTTJH_06170 [Bacteroidales bacterium]